MNHVWVVEQQSSGFWWPWKSEGTRDAARVIARQCYNQTRIRKYIPAPVPARAPKVKADADSWIKWAGGDCPVHAAEFVEIELRNRAAFGAGLAGSYSWWHLGSQSDIIAYRVVKP